MSGKYKGAPLCRYDERKRNIREESMRGQHAWIDLREEVIENQE
jgi:hypothetical protein